MTQEVEDGEVALRYALEELRAGARELGGNNRGEFVERYLNAEHPDKLTHTGEPWCAAFWSWCWLQASQELGRPAPVAYSRSASTLRDRLLELGRFRPRETQDARPILPGDACFWDWNGNGEPEHVNMVYEVRGSVLYTIGGNEGSEASGAPVSIKRRGDWHVLPQLLGFGLCGARTPDSAAVLGG